MPATSAANALHPLLHRNTLDFSQQSYATAFAGDEFFLVGPRGHRRLSEGACLEMVRAAIDASMPARQESGILELRDVAWAQRGVVINNRQVTIALFDKNDERVKFEIYSTADGGRSDQEVVHCHGIELRSHQPAPAKVDLTAQDGQTLVRLRLPTALEEGQHDYGIHPALMQTALDAAAELSEGCAPEELFKRVTARISQDNISPALMNRHHQFHYPKFYIRRVLKLYD